ncbi:MAG: iron-sulfur cluster assembly protein [bacterium]
MTAKMMNNTLTTYEIIIEQLQTVFDPEFPFVDIYTMGLIYDIMPDDEKKTIHITMTLTSPSCPE